MAGCSSQWRIVPFGKARGKSLDAICAMSGRPAPQPHVARAAQASSHLMLERTGVLPDIRCMAKLAKNGRKVSRPAKGDEIYGYTREGLPVWKPSFKPKS